MNGDHTVNASPFTVASAISHDDGDGTNTGAEADEGEIGITAATSLARTNTNAKRSQKAAILACLGCRPRKIKCERVGVTDSCERCTLLKIACRLPDRDQRKLRYSKDYIQDLENQVADLTNSLAAIRAAPVTSTSTSGVPIYPTEINQTGMSNEVIGADTWQNSSSQSTPSSTPAGSLVRQVFGNRGCLNTNDLGQESYFGPTSSLHLTQSLSSILSYCDYVAPKMLDFETQIASGVQQQLLDLYWTYHNEVYPLVYKEAFLLGLDAKRGPYYSRGLLLSVLACAASVSPNAKMRALTTSSEENDKGEVPHLLKQAQEAVEEEIQDPSLTTLQALMLLSTIDCAHSNHSKGWLRSGHACRLALDLGLHQDWAHISNSQLSPIDASVRQMTFWGCFGLDRMWAIYVGRPPVIQLGDISTPRLSRISGSWDARYLAVWVDLQTLAGQISDTLNTNNMSQALLDSHADALNKWFTSLEPSFAFSVDASPCVYNLHTQFFSLAILLNRHNAGFGNPTKRDDAYALRSREECVKSASRIATYIREYRVRHGSTFTMLGLALYNLSLAATTLIAQINDKIGVTKQALRDLGLCLCAMKDFESTDRSARSVRTLVLTIMGVCNIRVDVEWEQQVEPPRHALLPARWPEQPALSVGHCDDAFGAGREAASRVNLECLDTEGLYQDIFAGVQGSADFFTL